MRLDGFSWASQVLQEAAPSMRKLSEASQGVEAMFVKQLLGEMQKGTRLFGEGQAGSIYGDLFNDAIAQQVAKRGSFGIADLMERAGSKRIIAEALAKVRAPYDVSLQPTHGEPKDPS